MHRTTSLRARLALSGVSLIVALAVVEVFVRVTLAGPVHDDRGGEAGASFIDHDPRLGWLLKPGASARHASEDFDVSVAVNADGQREDRVYPLERVPGKARVLCIGDSFTFGYGVEHEQSYCERLEQELEDTEVINMGVAGYGTDQQLLLLPRGLAYRPDVVLVGLFEGDVFRNARDHQLVYPKPRFVLASGGGLELVNVPVPRVSFRTAAGNGAGGVRLESLALLAARGHDLYEHLGHGPAWPLTERILEEMERESTRAGARMLVVVIPKDRAVRGSGWRRKLHLRTLAEMRAMLERSGIAYVDTTVALTAWAEAHPGESPYFAHDGHWNAQGHGVAAAAIRPALARLLDRP